MRLGRYRLLLSVPALLAHAAHGQSLVPAERAGRAAALTRAPAAAAIRNGRVFPTWIEGQDRFWYLRDVEKGQETVLVDAATGARRRLFDRHELAAAASAVAPSPLDPLRLPVSHISLDPTGVATVTLGGAAPIRCVMASPVRCAAAPKPDPSLLMAPDGKRALIARDGNLWIRTVETGAERQLTTAGTPDAGFAIRPDTFGQAHLQRLANPAPLPPHQAWWSPDGRMIYVAHVDQRHVAPYPYLRSVPLDGSFRPKPEQVRLALAGEEPARTTWWLIDTETGARRPVVLPGDPIAHDEASRNMLGVWWKPDSSALVQLVRADDVSAGYLFEVDARTGKARTVLRQPQQGEGINLFSAGNYGPPSARLIADGREMLLYAVRNGTGHLHRVDLATGRMRPVTRGPWWVRDILAVDERRGRVYFAAAGREAGNPYDRHIYRVNLDGTGLTHLSPEAGDHLVIDPAAPFGFDGSRGYQPLSPSGRYLVYDVATVATPTRSQIRRTDDAGLVATFEQADASALLAAGYRPPEEFSALTADGKHRLHGLVFRPADHDPAKRYPVIDLQYGSPHVAVTPRSFVAAATLPIDVAPAAATAALGFIVVVVDGRGTPLRPLDFSRTDPGYLARMGLDDHVAFLKALAVRDPSVDLDRVGISGASYGGWTTIRALIEYPDMFRAGFAGAPPGAMHNMYHAPALTSSEGPARYAGGSLARPAPNARPANFAAFDNVAQAARVQGSLLVAIGEVDENVLPGSTLQFVEAAMRADRDIEVVTVPNASHSGFYTRHLTRRVWNHWLGLFRGERLAADAPIPGMSPEPEPK